MFKNLNEFLKFLKFRIFDIMLIEHPHKKKSQKTNWFPLRLKLFEVAQFL